MLWCAGGGSTGYCRLCHVEGDDTGVKKGCHFSARLICLVALNIQLVGGHLNMSQENSNTLQPTFAAGEVLHGLSQALSLQQRANLAIFFR